jgi:uroporphyrinogen decarboxylase
MNSRERTFLALAHEPGDRIPIDFWATPGLIEILERESNLTYAAFLDQYDVDLRYIEGPRYIGPDLAEDEDIWGVRRGSVSAGTDGKSEIYSEVTEPPLIKMDTPEEIDSYGHWPDPDWYDYSVIENQCDVILEDERVVVFMGDRLNRIAQLKPAMYMRGTEAILLDMAMREALAERILANIRSFYLAYTERILEAANGKIDIILTGDDFGAQNGMLVSPDMWRRLLKKGFEEYVSLIKRFDTTTMHHTCGAVREIIPDMIECGLDILQSIQPEANGMALADLKSAYGDRICFQGGISIQKTMPYGTPDDIRRDVAAIADLVGSKGGYIFCTSHNIQADTSIDNVIALMNAYHEFGRSNRA